MIGVCSLRRQRPQISVTQFVQEAGKVEVAEETAGGFLAKKYADATEKRDGIVKQPRKKRYSHRRYWVWKFDDERN